MIYNKKYKRWCKCCDNLFDTPHRFGSICPKCQEENHERKKIKNLFNGNHKSVVFL